MGAWPGYGGWGSGGSGTGGGGTSGSGGGFNWGGLPWQQIITGGLGLGSALLNRQQESPLLALIMQILAKGPGKGRRMFRQSLHNIAKIGAGARERATKTFASRGLGQSGIFGETLGNIEGQMIPELQYQADIDARKAAQAKYFGKLGMLLGTPGSLQQGQSAAGASTDFLANYLMWLLGQQKKS